MRFSIITSVYKNDKPEYVREALESITNNQTVKPDEVVLVVDGPVPDDLAAVIRKYEKEQPCLFFITWLPENKGLGNALRVGVEKTNNEIVARMDSDDIAASDRFEKQLKYLAEHPNVDIVGGQITEFIGGPENIVAKREVPLDNDAIYEYMKSRCALNHPTVMFRKESVMNVGNYQDWFWNEDYYLWIRMMASGCQFANLPDVLVNMRSGLEQYSRRGGRRYFDSEVGIKKWMLDRGMISKKEYVVNYIERFIIQLILPKSIRGWVFRKFARKKRFI